VLRSGFYSLLICVLVACGGNSRAPIEDRYGTAKAAAGKSKSNASIYYVQRGDTLYSLAFRFGLDFRKMAAANNIPAPYIIYPGQKIQLSEAAVKTNSTAAKPSSAKTSTAKVAAKTAPKTRPLPKPIVTGKTQTTSGSKNTAKVTDWRWPTKGKTTRAYSNSLHKGIDIGGNRGDAIEAVASGKVVYAGTGIVGFGELLIVKHNDVYLSAYGHNDALLVAEGAFVAAGEAIARMGSTSAESVKLHFEIRRNGVPIDPMALLPSR